MTQRVGSHCSETLPKDGSGSYTNRKARCTVEVHRASSFDGSAGNGQVQTLRDIMSSISLQQAGGPHQFARIFLYGNVIFNRRCAARCLLAQIMTARRTTSPTSFPNPCS